MLKVRHGERGEGRLGTLFGILVIAVTIYLGVKVIPVMVNAYAFRDFLETEARFAALRNKDEEVKNRVLRKAQELDLPVGAKSIQINRTPNRFDIRVKYTVPIKTPVYTYDWVFDEASTAPLF